jgi:thiol-disulfide isomerase/thioredoxin
MILLPHSSAWTQAADEEPVHKIRFLEGGWNDVLDAARESGKFIFVDCYTDWCGWCVELEKKTFSDQAVADFMNENFIAARFDMEEGDGMRLAAKFRVTGFPTLLVVTPELRPVFRIFGFMPPETFLPKIKEALDPEKQLSLTGVGPELDPGFPEFYLGSYGKGKARTWASDSTLEAFLAGREDWTDEVTWSVIFRFSGGEKGQAFLLSKRAELARLYGKDEIGDELLYKTGRYDNAEREAVRAIAIGKKEGEKVESTEKLLVEIRERK